MLDKELAKFVAGQPRWVREGFSRASKGPLNDDIDVLEELLLSIESTTAVAVSK